MKILFKAHFLFLLSFLIISCNNDVDSCLDKGGSYDYIKCQCDLKNRLDCTPKTGVTKIMGYRRLSE